jgi:hypothetical protein
LEKQIKELKAKMRELEAALERKMKATIRAPMEDSEADVQWHASCHKVVLVTAGLDCAALRREQLANNQMKARYICQAKSVRFREGDQVWL